MSAKSGILTMSTANQVPAFLFQEFLPKFCHFRKMSFPISRETIFQKKATVSFNRGLIEKC